MNINTINRSWTVSLFGIKYNGKVDVYSLVINNDEQCI